MVNLARQHAALDTELRLAISNVLASNRFILNSAVERFEQEWATYCEAKYCVGCANGTDALYLALVALGIERGEEVATVANAGGYATNAILRVGAIPTYIDINPRTLLIDLSKAVFCNAAIVTHLYGARVDVAAASRVFNCPIIEDCSHAHGTIPQGDIACYSFYPTKNLGAMGDAGALTTNNPLLAAKLRSLRQYGWGEKYSVVLRNGTNSRMDEIQAAVLSVKLPYLNDWNARRRWIANEYYISINDFECSQYQNIFHQYVIRMFDKNQRFDFRQHLLKCGVASEVHYPFPDCEGLPNTDEACDEVLSLPCYPEMTNDEVQQVIDACNSWSEK